MAGLQEQRKEEILKKGKYAMLEIIVDPDDNVPIACLTVRKVGSKDIASLIGVLKAQLEAMKQEYPAEYMLSELFVRAKYHGVDTEEVEEEGE